MLTSPFFRRLFVPYLLLIGLTVGVVGIVAARQLRSSYVGQTEAALRDASGLIAEQVGGELPAGRAAALDAQVKQLGQAIGARVTIIAADGTVIADNEADPATMENHRLRPEVVQADHEGEGSSIRSSATIHTDLLYFARRVSLPDGRPCFIRVARHLSELDRHLGSLYASLFVAAALAVLGAGAICYTVARRQAAPVVDLTGFADALRQGDLSRRILNRERGEMGTLATALNAMADSLGQLLAQTANDKSQLLTILSSMSEGVIATDAHQRILLSNGAAADLLDFKGTPADGRQLWEAVRSQPILQAAGEALARRQRRSFQVGPILGRHLEVTISPFQSGHDSDGLVIVAHDATQSVRYQELRKEFVANVSHELRTPLTAIKGFAETLRDGALEDPVRGRQFLATIEKHADQLSNLVSDLLELSRLESHAGLPNRVPVQIALTVRKAADMLRPAAERKSQKLEVELDGQLPELAGNPDYLERAVANLLDNAIKYTPEGGLIRVSGRVDTNYVVVEVTDNGIGIPAADLPRVFERFYRVDRSRSRDMGGTGLGLSIVKHIAQVHRGSVEVSSTPGQGSTFRLKLPVPPPFG